MATERKDQTTEPRIRWARIEGYDIDAMKNAVRLTKLHLHGDCRLVWISTGDLAQMELAGEAEDCSGRW